MQKIIILAIPLGWLFISVFTLISKTAQEVSVASASIANKMSVVIPVISAIMFFHESLYMSKLAGIILALLSVVLSVYKKGNKERHENQKNDNKKWLYPVFVFIGSGIIDAYINYIQKQILKSETETSLFILVCFLSAGLSGIIFVITYLKEGAQFINAKNIVAGVALGIPNFYSIFFVMKAIQEGTLEGSVIYPIVNVGVVVGSTLLALIFFKERLNKIQILGIMLSIVAIALISFHAV
jgi:drug/metabolite transporter (DMT)-like permease